MISEEDKHLADVFKIGGFAFMSPLGKIVLSLPEVEWSDLTIKFFIILLVYSLLFYFGIIFLLKSIERVEEKKNNKWEKKQ